MRTVGFRIGHNGKGFMLRWNLKLISLANEAR